MSVFARLAKGYKRFTKGDEGLQTPDVTRVQEIAFGQAVIAILAVFGFGVDDDVRDLILFVSAALGIALPASDAVIRNGRAKAAPEIREVQQTAAERARPTLSADDRRRLILQREELSALHRRH